MSPTARSLAYARAQGWIAQVVERWVPQAGRRIDLFGCIDLIVLDGSPGPIGVQACAGASHAARRTKMQQEPRLAAWLASGARAEVWSWSKQSSRGKRKLWTLRREPVTADNLGAHAAT